MNAHCLMAFWWSQRLIYYHLHKLEHLGKDFELGLVVFNNVIFFQLQLYEVVYACDPCTLKARARGLSQAWGEIGLYSDYNPSQHYIAKTKDGRHNSVGRVFAKHAQHFGFNSQHCISWLWWQIPVSPVLGRWRQLWANPTQWVLGRNTAPLGLELSLSKRS